MTFCPHCGERVGDRETLCPSCGHMIQPDSAGKKTGHSAALWLIVGAGLLVVLGITIFGIIPAVLIPKDPDAPHKDKQVQTVTELRHTSVMLLSYATNHVAVFPDVDTIEDLAAVLASEQGGEPIAVVDSWNRPYRYECWHTEESEAGCTSFRLASAGRDGVFEHESLADYDEEPFDPVDYDRDLVLGDGFFLQYPSARPPTEAPEP